MLIGRSPLRISFIGGGTDMEEYHNKFNGYSISATINKYTFVAAKIRSDKIYQGLSPDFFKYFKTSKIYNQSPKVGHGIAITCLKEMKFKKGIDLFFSADVAPGSGLGASSSLASNLVSTILKIQGKEWDKHKIAMTIYRIGHDVLKWGIGKQDEFAAVFGGFNMYKFSKDQVKVEPIKLKKNTLKEFEENSMLFFLGERKPSADILKIQSRNINRLNQKTMKALHKVSELSLELHDAFKQNDLTKFEEFLREGWEQKKQFAKGISNERIDFICRQVELNGSKAMKVTGQGGGGHLFVYAEKKKQTKIIKKLKKLGVPYIDFKYKNSNATVQNLSE